MNDEDPRDDSGRPADWAQRFESPQAFHERNLRREAVRAHERELRCMEQIRKQEAILRELRECDRLGACMVDAPDGLAVRPDRLASYKAAVLGIVAISRECKLFRTMPESEPADDRYELPAVDGAPGVER